MQVPQSVHILSPSIPTLCGSQIFLAFWACERFSAFYGRFLLAQTCLLVPHLTCLCSYLTSGCSPRLPESSLFSTSLIHSDQYGYTAIKTNKQKKKYPRDPPQPKVSSIFTDFSEGNGHRDSFCVIDLTVHERPQKYTLPQANIDPQKE